MFAYFFCIWVLLCSLGQTKYHLVKVKGDLEEPVPVPEIPGDGSSVELWGHLWGHPKDVVPCTCDCCGPFICCAKACFCDKDGNFV